MKLIIKDTNIIIKEATEYYHKNKEGSKTDNYTTINIFLESDEAIEEIVSTILSNYDNSFSIETDNGLIYQYKDYNLTTASKQIGTSDIRLEFNKGSFEEDV